jgi:predicted nucleic acid-binding Zn ribbon protein
MPPATISQMIHTIEALLETRLAATGRDLRAKVASVRRRLPARVRKQADVLVQMHKRLENPKLALKTDPSAAAPAFTVCRDYLEGIKPHKMRRRKRSALIAGIAFKILVVLIALLVVLRWRGFV